MRDDPTESCKGRLKVVSRGLVHTVLYRPREVVLLMARHLAMYASRGNLFTKDGWKCATCLKLAAVDTGSTVHTDGHSHSVTPGSRPGAPQTSPPRNCQ